MFSFQCSFHSGVSSNTRFSSLSRVLQFFFVLFLDFCLAAHKSCLQIQRWRRMLLPFSLAFALLGLCQKEDQKDLDFFVLFLWKLEVNWRVKFFLQLECLDNDGICHSLQPRLDHSTWMFCLEKNFVCSLPGFLQMLAQHFFQSLLLTTFSGQSVALATTKTDQDVALSSHEI